MTLDIVSSPNALWCQLLRPALGMWLLQNTSFCGWKVNYGPGMSDNKFCVNFGAGYCLLP